MNSMLSWFSSSELSKIPGLPKTKRSINRLAKANNWQPKRIRKGRGGGWEYHISSFPENVQVAILLKMHSPRVKGMLKVSEKYDPEALWDHYARKPDKVKDVAKSRLKVLQAVKVLIDQGVNKGAAKRIIAKQVGINSYTIGEWFKMVKGRHKSDWLPSLLPKYKGRQKEAPMPIEAWDIFKGDYLRVEKPAATACYERLQRIAAKNEWTLPSLKTFLRKIKRELPKPVLILAREGQEALNRFYPAQQRDHSVFHAMEAVNADGHKFDVFVRFPDGEICRPVMVAWQDIYSGKILSYRVDKTENTDSVRLSYGDMVELYGIPDHAYLDNGRGFASKWMTGGIPNRYRFKVKKEEPTGIMIQNGTTVHWCKVRSGQSKPIERSFLDLTEYVSKNPAFHGAYTGNKPDAKPENYGSKAIALDKFLKVLKQEIIAHNARSGRRSQVCAGRSFDAVFSESYERCTIRKASANQRRLWLLAAEGVTASRYDGSVTLMSKNRYWCNALAKYAGCKVVVRFDPDNLYGSVYVYRLDGKYIGEAECVQAAGFGDSRAAKEHNRLRNQRNKEVKKQLKAERRMNALEVASKLPNIEPPETPKTKVVKPDFKKAVGHDFDFDIEELYAEGTKKIKELRKLQSPF